MSDGARQDSLGFGAMPARSTSDSELRQRFEREAKTLAALSHPHICPVYDVGSQHGVNFLAMEHLEGETLAQRLTKGALPLDQALSTAIELADAFDKAHRKGIVHRDLKPGNIMLTKNGAKLLDFGLAKLRPASVAGGVALSEAPTASRPFGAAQGEPLTGAGSINVNAKDKSGETPWTRGMSLSNDGEIVHESTASLLLKLGATRLTLADLAKK